MKLIPFAVLLQCISLQAGNILPVDSSTVRDIEEIVIVSTPKETEKLRAQPVSSSLFSQHELQATHSESLKELSAHVPNFYMPDYGSSLTSAAYLRGIGSRINTPAVGLYVDNVSYADKSAYDIDFLDVERIDVLRGPQGTLYGRNTMGGLIRVYTRNPFRYQGTDLRTGISTHDDRYRLSLSHHRLLLSNLALSAGAYYESAQGLYQNACNGQDVDGLNRTGGRMRLIWLPANDWKIDFGTDYSYRDEGGYAYHITTPTNELPADLKGYAGTVATNRSSFYRRSLLNSNLSITHYADRFTFTSVTAFQNLNDNMTLDQDFTPRDYFSLTQRQRSNSWSEELTVRSNGSRRWEWVGGLYALHQSLHTESPVSLTEEFMHNTLTTANHFMANYKSFIDLSMPRSPFVSDGAFETPVTDLAAFHQSTFRHLFGINGLSLMAGVRVEHERMRLKHAYGGTLHYDMSLNLMGHTVDMPDMANPVWFDGTFKRDYTQWLPKVAVQYQIDRRNNVYASWSKGYRSGGFNVQMFSDLVQGKLSQQMMERVYTGIEQTFSHIPNMPETIKQQILGQIAGRLNRPFTGTPADTYYKPEYSYNYEVGGHFSLCGNSLQIDVAAFLMDVHDQQISKMVDSGLGRTMVNAGRGQSAGMEVYLHGSALTDNLTWNTSYGYTHSVFKKYEPGLTDTQGKEVNYNGNYVPFAPRHTVSAGIDYTFHPTGIHGLHTLTIGVDMTGAGEIYWTEDNSLKQPFYALLNAHVQFHVGQVWLNLWGKNLTSTRYNVFCFTNQVTMQELRFAQPGRPLQFGVDASIHF
ncbi:MAG: TonB-dependent receptor [Clostridium sp.]|nr:TonB-dependent receptor [Clostridium sp.]